MDAFRSESKDFYTIENTIILNIESRTNTPTNTNTENPYKLHGFPSIHFIFASSF
jgi:hypothetical protein